MLVFTFPGQGSQRSGMGRPWTEHPSWEVVTEASSATGRDIERLLLDAPMDELTETANAQLATFVASLTVLDAVERVGLTPAACAGHSLGEYTALVAGGAVSFADGAHLVVARGDAMGRAGEDAPGTMAALLGISDDDAEAACQRVEGEVWVANYNAPGQVVVAGTSDAIAKVGPVAKELGARKILPVPVSGAFHTPLMGGARPALRKALGDVAFRAPEVPVVANVDARVHDDPADWPALLSAQLCAPVRWRQTLETLVGLGATTLVEVGPGGVLSGLARRTVPEVQTLSVAKPDDLDALLDSVTGTTADVWRDELDVLQGEHLYMSERVVVSPCSGIFVPEESLAAPGTGLLSGTGGAGAASRVRGAGPGAAGGAGPGTAPAGGGGPGSAPGATVGIGDLVGRVGVIEVRTPFAGQVVRWLSVSGERVQEGQPLAWLRTPATGR
ncbi:MAG: ACP S-malonyltransferase [Acidimicrobiales bacterium]